MKKILGDLILFVIIYACRSLWCCLVANNCLSWHTLCHIFETDYLASLPFEKRMSIQIHKIIFNLIAGDCIALRKNRKEWLWIVNSLAFGVLGWGAVCFSRKLCYEKETGCNKRDTLGWCMFVISVAGILACLFIGNP